MECTICGRTAAGIGRAFKHCTGQLICLSCWDSVVVEVLEVATRAQGRDARAREGQVARALLLRAGQASRTR